MVVEEDKKAVKRKIKNNLLIRRNNTGQQYEFRICE